MTFVRNLRALASYLHLEQPAVVRRGHPAGGRRAPRSLDTGTGTRPISARSELPSTSGEPSSLWRGNRLHHWCHHAVYLDRTFNAGHYLQSQDRIHRLGLRDGQVTRFTLLLSEGTIDDTVDQRLREKVTALARLMNDPGLVRVALPEPDEHHDGAPVFQDDDQAMQAHLVGAVTDAA